MGILRTSDGLRTIHVLDEVTGVDLLVTEADQRATNLRRRNTGTGEAIGERGLELPASCHERRRVEVLSRKADLGATVTVTANDDVRNLPVLSSTFGEEGGEFGVDRRDLMSRAGRGTDVVAEVAEVSPKGVEQLPTSVVAVLVFDSAQRLGQTLFLDAALTDVSFGPSDHEEVFSLGYLWCKDPMSSFALVVEVVAPLGR